jgi:hypothetical protein
VASRILCCVAVRTEPDKRFALAFEARDYVEGMWMMLQQPKPEDFVLATGETHRVREFTNKAFDAVGITLRCGLVPSLYIISPIERFVRWEGSAENEQGIDIATGKTVVRVDARYFRPAEVEYVFFLSLSCYFFQSLENLILFLTPSLPIRLFLAFCSVIQPRLSAFWAGSGVSTLTRSSGRW